MGERRDKGSGHEVATSIAEAKSGSISRRPCSPNVAIVTRPLTDKRASPAAALRTARRVEPKIWRPELLRGVVTRC